MARGWRTGTGRRSSPANRARRELELANAHLREYARQVEAVTRMLKKRPDQVEEALLVVQEHARESLAEVRRSVRALRPLQMEERKGVAAVQHLVQEFQRTTGVEADLVVVVEGIAVELPIGHDLCLYRMVQEGLTNAFRHGRATRARVRLRFAPGALVAAVEDNGRSTVEVDKPGLGIRERAEVLGGRVQAGRAPTGGFVLQLTLPTGGAVSA